MPYVIITLGAVYSGSALEESMDAAPPKRCCYDVSVNAKLSGVAPIPEEHRFVKSHLGQTIALKVLN